MSCASGTRLQGTLLSIGDGATAPRRHLAYATWVERRASIRGLQTAYVSSYGERLSSASSAAGNFLVSGRKIPRDGGIILAVGKSKQEIETLIQEDPFHQHGLAEFRVIEFRASQRAGDMPKRIET